MLFDQRTRADTDHMSHGESDWEYLDRSARPEAQRVRDLLDAWMSTYPDEGRQELCSRMRCGDDVPFQAAAFELLVFSTLKALGCEVQVHPEIPGSRRHPDFLVRTPSGESVFLEATLASEFDQTAQAAARRRNVVLDAIDRLESPDFLIGISADGDPERPPNGRRIRQALRQWIVSLDYETARTALEMNQPDPFPKLAWEDDGRKVEFDAIARRRDRRGPGKNAIGAIFGGARWGEAHLAIREAIRNKGGHYGALPHPLMIAINVDALSVDTEDEVGALFGDEQYVVRMYDDTAKPQKRRAPNGAWNGPNGPRYTRVAGAWIFRRITPWSIASRTQTVYFNPFATSQLPDLFASLPNFKARGDKLCLTQGRQLRDLFDLPPEWPENS